MAIVESVSSLSVFNDFKDFSFPILELHSAVQAPLLHNVGSVTLPPTLEALACIDDLGAESTRKLILVTEIGFPDPTVELYGNIQTLAAFAMEKYGASRVQVCDSSVHELLQQFPCMQRELWLSQEFPTLPNAVRSNLFLGSAITSQEQSLATLGITHVVNCTTDVDNCCDESHNTQHKAQYVRVPVEDDPTADIGAHLAVSCDFISTALQAENNNKVLVHCWQGRSRSATVLIYYLMQKDGSAFQDVFNEVNKARGIGLNSGFENKLRALSCE
eukprot:TRINITY_DN15669_c0_g1_i1.p2 TRINITY_DN15669_c0_g1~~TRINITY_DN15669_c0_g1_i1.p2  ORF type:complete len:274 (+),score=12.52 TRINITY_DN15669_c0_g1_i1:1360-2181(+)